MRPLLISIFICGIATPSLQARTWTSITGKNLEGDLIHETPTTVTIKRDGDGKELSIRINQLSHADRSWLMNKDNAMAKEEKQGPQLPKEIAAIIAERGKIIFEDDFNREDQGDKDDLGPDWETSSETRAQGDKQNDLVDGVLEITMSPRADHSVTTKHGFDEVFKDAVVSLRIKIGEGDNLKLAYNDKKDKSVWAGHINGITIRPYSIHLDDERTGRFNMTYRDNKETPEAKEAMKSSSKTFKIDLETDEWHDVVTYHNDDTLTVWIDGKEVATFSSPGFAHETKREFAFGVPKKASVDDLTIWAINP